MSDTKLQLNGRRVIDAEIDGVDLRDFPDFCGTYFCDAVYEDGTPLNDDELEQLADKYGEVLNEMAHEHCIGMSDYLGD